MVKLINTDVVILKLWSQFGLGKGYGLGLGRKLNLSISK